ncbi:MAG: anion transporter [Phototrophicales bacterium]|nr:MAG: anion transporter [Phototrophicales bacterium]
MTLLHGVIIAAAYAAIAVGRVPGLRMKRATIALTAAVLLIVVGALTEEEALHAIDLGTLLLLGAMMVININLRLGGFFRAVTSRTLRFARTPGTLLALIIASSGILSALFLNDTICLMLTPLVVDITRRLQRDPIPYLIGLAVATNVGSVATITGNPQNIIIGQASGIAYVSFMLALAPVAAFGLAICWFVIRLLFRHEFQGRLPDIELPPPQPFAPLLSRTLLVVGALLIAFLVGAPIVTAACAAAGVLLVSRLRPEKLLALDWDLLAFFAGLFAITGAIEATGLSAQFIQLTEPLLRAGIPGLSAMTAILSNVVSNVPAVLLLQGAVPIFENPEQAWLTLAMASTLAGNFTLLGSAATLIVAELADRRGVRLSFGVYLRAGIPITLLTLACGVIWLMLTT